MKNEINDSGSTHNGGHVVALVGGRHQCAEVRFTVHAHRRTLVLHVLGDWRHQSGGGAVVTVAAISWRERRVSMQFYKLFFSFTSRRH